MDGEPPQEEDFSQIPIIERSQHKVSQIASQVAEVLKGWQRSSTMMLNDAELESSFIGLYRCHCPISKDRFRY